MKRQSNTRARRPHPRLRRTYEWILRFRGSPKQVARGMAIGVFVAFTPLQGFQMILAVILATVTSSNRAVAIAAVWITNPFTMLPIYLTTYRVGRFFMPTSGPIDVKKRLLSVLVDENGEWLNVAQQMRELLALGTDILIPLFIGGAIVGLTAGMIAYFLTLVVIGRGRRYLRAHRRARSTES